MLVVVVHPHGWLTRAHVHLRGWLVVEMVAVHPHTILAERHLLGEMEAEPPMVETAHLRKYFFLFLRYTSNTASSWNPSSRTPYIADSERSAWDAGSKTPGRPTALDAWNADTSSNTTARTPGNYSAASPDFSGFNAKEFSAPTPGNPMSAPTPSAPTPGPISAPTPSGYGNWGESAPTPGRGGFPNTPGAWGGADDEDDGPRYAPPSPR